MFSRKKKFTLLPAKARGKNFSYLTRRVLSDFLYVSQRRTRLDSLAVVFFKVRQGIPSKPLSSSHDKGFVLVTGLPLVGLLAMSLFCCLALIWMMQKKHELLFTCEKGLIQTQQSLVDGANKLLALNKPIQWTVFSKKWTQRALLLAKTPVDIALLKARLAQLELQLRNYALQQKTIHSTAETQARLKLLQLLREQQHNLQQTKNQWNKNVHISTRHTLPRLSLTVRRIDPSAVLYQDTPQFSEQQSLKFSWVLKSSSFFPKWLRWLNQNTFLWQDSCSSRPFKQENSRWVSEIGEAVSY